MFSAAKILIIFNVAISPAFAIDERPFPANLWSEESAPLCATAAVDSVEKGFCDLFCELWLKAPQDGGIRYLPSDFAAHFLSIRRERAFHFNGESEAELALRDRRFELRTSLDSAETNFKREIFRVEKLRQKKVSSLDPITEEQVRTSIGKLKTEFQATQLKLDRFLSWENLLHLSVASRPLIKPETWGASTLASFGNDVVDIRGSSAALEIELLTPTRALLCESHAHVENHETDDESHDSLLGRGTVSENWNLTTMQSDLASEPPCRGSGIYPYYQGVFVGVFIGDPANQILDARILGPNWVADGTITHGARQVILKKDSRETAWTCERDGVTYLVSRYGVDEDMYTAEPIQRFGAELITYWFEGSYHGPAKEESFLQRLLTNFLPVDQRATLSEMIPGLVAIPRTVRTDVTIAPPPNADPTANEASAN